MAGGWKEDGRRMEGGWKEMGGGWEEDGRRKERARVIPMIVDSRGSDPE